MHYHKPVSLFRDEPQVSLTVGDFEEVAVDQPRANDVKFSAEIRLLVLLRVSNQYLLKRPFTTHNNADNIGESLQLFIGH